MRAAAEGFRPPAANRIRTGHGSTPANGGSGHTSDGIGPPPATLRSRTVRSETPQPPMAPAYNRAEVTYPSSAAPHELRLTQMAALVAQIVEQEGPMHRQLVARRVAQAERRRRTGSSERARTGSRTVRAVDGALRWAARQGTIEHTDDFCMTPAQRADPPVRDRSQERTSAQARKPSYLPPVEICVAAKRVERENGVVQGQEQIRAIAQLLGYGRVRQPLKERVQQVLEECPER